MQETSKNVKAESRQLEEKRTYAEYCAPSEGKKEPPGLLRGGDDRGLGVKRDQQIEGTEEKGPKGNYCPRETDSQTTDRVKAEEVNNPYLSHWAEWAKWFGIEPDSFNWNGPPKFTWEVQNDMGKGQGSKGGPHPKTDPWGG